MILSLNKQVVSLPLAKKLKELRCRQDSLWYWTLPDNCNKWTLNFGLTDTSDYSAYTVGELGFFLPKEVNLPFKNGKPRKLNNSLRMWPGYKWNTCYAKHPGVGESIMETAETEADSRAKMYIWLIENGLVEVDSNEN